MNGRLPKKITRRSFLSTSGKLALGGAGILLGSTGLFYYGAIQEKNRVVQVNAITRELPGNIVKIGELEKLNAIQGFKKVGYTATIQDAWVTNSKQGFVYITKNDKELFILSPVCTHLGCIVEPVSEAQQLTKKELFFLCPCHGAEFDIVGNAIGVVPQGLDTYKPIITGGNVYIDISSPIIRT
jgi:menaquinol-cytochrome c reductase iron-sulfur subunit